MEWTYRLTAGILLVATAVEVALAFGFSAVTQIALAEAAAGVFLFAGAGWIFAGMFVSGSGRVAPPLTTAPVYGLGGTSVQPSASSELIVSRAGAERVAQESVSNLARGSPFMIPAVLYGLALLAISLWLAM